MTQAPCSEYEKGKGVLSRNYVLENYTDFFFFVCLAKEDQSGALMDQTRKKRRKKTL